MKAVTLGHPLRSVVVYLRPAERIPAAPFVIPWEENDESQITRYAEVRLWEVPAERVLNSPSYALWPLPPLLAEATDETTVAPAERLAALGKSGDGTLRAIVAHVATDSLEQVRARFGLGLQAALE
jgi:hypothetical protein